MYSLMGLLYSQVLFQACKATILHGISPGARWNMPMFPSCCKCFIPQVKQRYSVSNDRGSQWLLLTEDNLFSCLLSSCSFKAAVTLFWQVYHSPFRSRSVFRMVVFSPWSCEQKTAVMFLNHVSLSYAKTTVAYVYPKFISLPCKVLVLNSYGLSTLQINLTLLQILVRIWPALCFLFGLKYKRSDFQRNVKFVCICTYVFLPKY